MLAARGESVCGVELEVYVLAGSRHAHVATQFLQRFLPTRRAASDEYPFPEFSTSPERVYGDPDELMRRLESSPDEAYAIYWDADEASTFRQGMLFFTRDAAMIVGLVIAISDIAQVLLDVAQVVDGRFGFISGESPPPGTRDEFIRVCREGTLTRLVDGCIYHGADL